MKLRIYLIYLCLVCVVSAQNQHDYIIEEEFIPLEQQTDGSQTYKYRFKTSNGIERSEDGYQNPDSSIGLVVQGSYTYIRPDGIQETVAYTADKEGFRVVPKPPAIGPLDAYGFLAPKRIASAALASLAG